MNRIKSLDILRGAVMVLMAIDHVRVNAGVPAGGPDAAIFFTRWVTHFCAPGFAFFAGTTIFFHAGKLNDKNKLSRFLLLRGLLFVLLEVSLIRFFWTFNLDINHFFLAGVIWMLGWCMVLMALLVRFKPSVLGIIGLVIILAQQLFRFAPRLVPTSIESGFSMFWNFIYPTGFEMPENISILYVIVPWIGVMAAGYGFGLILSMDAAMRDKWCRRIGIGAIALFLLKSYEFNIKK